MGDDRTIHRLRDPLTMYAGREAYWLLGSEASDKEVNSKIHSAFAGVKSFPFKRMIFQFWRLVADEDHDGRPLLESRGNVYAVSPYNHPLQEKYRASCMKYQYSIKEGDNDPAWIISGGPFATAFLNHFPEVVLDLRVHPLAVCALECELTCCVILPVFYSGSSDCVGVVECSMKNPALLMPIFNELKRELERVGLDVQGSWPYKTISGDLEAAKVEIERALEVASQSHGLTLGQVWIQGESDHHESQLLVKLSGYSICSDDDPLSSIKDFYDKLDVICLKPGEGLTWRTLQTHEPHLCSNINKLSDNRGVLALLSANANSKCASFVMCLRSTHTGDLVYLFEFFWPCKRDPLILLQTLLSTLKGYLPSFKFASGELLGEDISVVHVKNASSSRPFKIVLGNQLSEAPKPLTSGDKRKLSDFYAGQSDLSDQYPLTNIDDPDGKDDHDDNDDDELAILATYRLQNLLLYLPSLSTFENVIKKLKEEFELDPTKTYKVKYEVSPGQWSSLECLESCRMTEDKGLVKLRVLSNVKEVGWRWRTNS